MTEVHHILNWVVEDFRLREVVSLLSQHLAGALGALLVTMILYAWSQGAQRRAELHAVARTATEDFYRQASNLLPRPELPDGLKTVLYDLLLATTKRRLGKVAFRALSRPEKYPYVQSSGFHEDLMQLSEKHPELASAFMDALRTGFAAILCSYGHSDHSVTATLVNTTNEQVRLVSAVERVDALFESKNLKMRDAQLAAAA